VSAPHALAGWHVDHLRLPKLLESDARGPALLAALKRDPHKLWAEGRLEVPSAAWSPSLASALTAVQQLDRLVQGLEQAGKTLEREARGLSLADARSATARGQRVSRLLLVSDDGTQRFYRQLERIVSDQGPRLLALYVRAGADRFASVVPQASGVVRALLVEHKDSVANVLLALYPESAGE
jgi:hypothetical protein